MLLVLAVQQRRMIWTLVTWQKQQSLCWLREKYTVVCTGTSQHFLVGGLSLSSPVLRSRRWHCSTKALIFSSISSLQTIYFVEKLLHGKKLTCFCRDVRCCSSCMSWKHKNKRFFVNIIGSCFIALNQHRVVGSCEFIKKT